MARVLQIRRGTTAQNDNFTGMPGELSFDTDTNELRIHDGTTLGGFILARADQIGDTENGATFDINSVSDEFWAQKFAELGINQPQVCDSTEMPIFNTTYMEYVFGALSNTPRDVRAILKCQTADAGYAPGDVCTAFGIGTYTCPLFNTSVDDNGLHVKLAIGSQNFWVAHNSTGVQTNISNANWKIQFRVYC